MHSCLVLLCHAYAIVRLILEVLEMTHSVILVYKVVYYKFGSNFSSKVRVDNPPGYYFILIDVCLPDIFRVEQMGCTVCKQSKGFSLGQEFTYFNWLAGVFWVKRVWGFSPSRAVTRSGPRRVHVY